MTATAFYHRVADGTLRPTSLAAGPPWLPGTQHGSMVTALFARAVELVPSAVPMQLCRLTVELARPVPTGSTTVEATVGRDGRRLQTLDLTLGVDGAVCARGTAIRLRTAAGIIEPDDQPAPWPDDHQTEHPSEATLAPPFGSDSLWEAHDARWCSATPGDGNVWLRPHIPLIDDETDAAAVRVALVADLVMTGGGILPMDRYLVVNPDLTLSLSRLPESAWIQVRSIVRVEQNGIGHSEGALYDERGRIGHVTKTLLVDRRGA